MHEERFARKHVTLGVLFSGKGVARVAGVPPMQQCVVLAMRSQRDLLDLMRFLSLCGDGRFRLILVSRGTQNTPKTRSQRKRFPAAAAFPAGPSLRRPVRIRLSANSGAQTATLKHGVVN